jgi:hypothetical protein
MRRKLQKIDLDQMEQQVFKWKCDKGIVFVNGVLVREIFIRENSRTIWEKRKNKRVRGLRRAMEIYEDSRCQE